MARLNIEALASREEPEPEETPAPAPALKKAAPRPTPKKAAPRPEPATQEPAVHIDQATPTAQPEPAEPSKNEEPASGEGKTVGVPVHLPDDVNDRLLAWMTLTGRSHPVVLLDAIETVYEQLGDLIQHKLGPDDRPKTSLFARSNRQAPKTNPGENPHKHTVRIAKEARDVLDDLTAKFAAPSRNFLIIAAYDGYLPSLEQIAEKQHAKDEETARTQKENG